MESVNTNYRLGVDLGTSSIGVAVYSLNDDNKIEKLIFLDSYLFREPVDPETKVTTNTNRRNARLMRRQLERKAKRVKKIAYIANTIGITKDNLDSIPGEKIHELRNKAVSEKLTLPELIKVFCHMVKNRGYKGDTREDGKVKKKIGQTEKMLGSMQTLGQLLYQKKIESKNNIAWRKLNQDGTFITRDVIEEEFDLIYEEQKKYHKELNGYYKITYEKMFLDFAGKEKISIKDAFHSAMFYQRPIRWSLNSVGFCSLEQDEHRAAIAQIEYQKYRIAESLANIRVKVKTETKQTERPLSVDEIKKVYDFMQEGFKQYNERQKITYSLIYEELGFKDGKKFTIDRGNKDDGLKGIATLKTFYDLDKEEFKFINAWNELSDKSQELVIEFLTNVTKYSDIQDNPEDCLVEEFCKLITNIKDRQEHIEQAINFVKMLRKEKIFSKNEFVLEQGRASYSVKALKKITAELLKGKNEQDIIASLYPCKVEPTSVLRGAEKLMTKNPVIDKVLREFERTISFVISKFGTNPSEITIELTRELKNSLAKRN